MCYLSEKKPIAVVISLKLQHVCECVMGVLYVLVCIFSRFLSSYEVPSETQQPFMVIEG